MAEPDYCLSFPFTGSSSWAKKGSRAPNFTFALAGKSLCEGAEDMFRFMLTKCRSSTEIWQAGCFLNLWILCAQYRYLLSRYFYSASAVSKRPWASEQHDDRNGQAYTCALSRDLGDVRRRKRCGSVAPVATKARETLASPAILPGKNWETVAIICSASGACTVALTETAALSIRVSRDARKSGLKPSERIQKTFSCPWGRVFLRKVHTLV